MRTKDILLVTFPVDLGNRTIESNLHQIFCEDMDFFRFAAQHADDLTKGVDYRRSVKDRLLSAFPLRKALGPYVKKNAFVLFNGLSPAFLSYGSWRPERTAIVFDWTRLLYPSVLGQKLDKGIVFKLHRHILQTCSVILCWTDAIIQNLQEHYGVDPSRIKKVPAPFLVENMDIAPRPTPDLPRVLFVGGDLRRKGGDVLLEQFEARLKGKGHLTMLTSDQAANVAGINHLADIHYGTLEHRKVFEENDILILPTRIDAYPQVIGEAAAAGLAVITTMFALGASEIIIEGKSGYITQTPAEAVDKLADLITSKTLIDSFKSTGYAHMHSKFSKENIRKEYFEALAVVPR